MFISILTIATASLLPFANEVAFASANTSVSVSLYPAAEKHQSENTVPTMLEFFHRGSGRCELQQNCQA